MKYSWILLMFVCISCQNNEKLRLIKERNIDSITKNNTQNKESNIDTNYSSPIVENNFLKLHFNLDELSSEGGEGYAFYSLQSKKIKKSVIHLYGEMEQTQIVYHFRNDSIFVTETTFQYLKSLGEISSNKDMKKQSCIKYVINMNDTSLNNNRETKFEIFNEFKKQVPLYLGGNVSNR